jgi:hypothetical protein
MGPGVLAVHGHDDDPPGGEGHALLSNRGTWPHRLPKDGGGLGLAGDQSQVRPQTGSRSVTREAREQRHGPMTAAVTHPSMSFRAWRRGCLATPHDATSTPPAPPTMETHGPRVLWWSSGQWLQPQGEGLLRYLILEMRRVVRWQRRRAGMLDTGTSLVTVLLMLRLRPRHPLMATMATTTVCPRATCGIGMARSVSTAWHRTPP